MPALVSREGAPRVRFSEDEVRAMAERMLRALRIEQAELSVVLVDDRTIHALNRAHRDKDRPTDVLAFSQNEDARGRFVPFDARAPALLGDVVISLDTARAQAARHGLSLEREVALLLAHGLLHLLGLDHRDDGEERRMKARTQPLAHAGLARRTPSASGPAKRDRSRDRGPDLAKIAPSTGRRARKER